MLNVKEILSISLVLFSVIDILGTIPIIIAIQNRGVKIQAGRATIISAVIMVSFLFLGQRIIHLFGLDIASFAVAGSFVMFIVALEMILGITLIKDDPDSNGASSVVPLAFPLIAGAGTLTTILSLKSVYAEVNMLVGILLNLIFVYLVLLISPWLERVLGKSGLVVMRRVFGIILLAIAVKIFKSHAIIAQ